MNRLVIIGNGFDLAHGLKSSVKDFIEDYFKNVINTFLRTYSYNDELVELKFKSANFTYNITDYPISVDEIHNIIESLKKDERISFNIKSLLLERVYTKIFKEFKWVDLEVEFFYRLIAIERNSPQTIELYNKQFDYLKDKLTEYLINKQKLPKNFLFEPIVNCFTENINKNEIVTLNISKDEKPESLYLLSFNYTDTIQRYKEACNLRIPTEANYIHGSLCKQHGDPIFGFGDEFNKLYLEFEDKNNNDLFQHIKSFEYLKNQNYHNLTRYIESKPFQVHIYGHSCGVSDRTMFNQIFEHENCKSIKIFFYERGNGSNDFTEKTHEISRHIKDKTLLRKKLVPYTLSRKMPQPKISELNE